MRLVHVTIPAGKRDAVTSTLDDQGVDYVMTEEVSGREYTAVVTFPLPTEAVEPVLDELRADGLTEEAFTVIVEAQTVISRRFDRLKEQYSEDKSDERIAREELEAAAEGLAPATWNYIVLTVISVLIATAGILLDSAATVVGSMVIAPLIGPAMATSVGTVIDDRDLFLRGVRLQVLGFGIAILTAAIFALVVRYGNLAAGVELLALGELNERVAPGFLTLVIALGAGAAGALSLRSGVSASLVGVMIAVALVPPAAVTGIGIAYLRPSIVLGSSVLVAVNALSINLAALLVFWYSGYRPARWFQLGDAKNALFKRVAVLTVAILVLTAFLGGVTYTSFLTATAEGDIDRTVETVLDRHDELTLLDVRVVSSERPLSGAPERVVVTAGYDSGTDPPSVAGELADALAEHDVAVEVRLVEIQRATPAG